MASFDSLIPRVDGLRWIFYRISLLDFPIILRGNWPLYSAEGFGVNQALIVTPAPLLAGNLIFASLSFFFFFVKMEIIIVPNSYGCGQSAIKLIHVEVSEDRPSPYEDQVNIIIEWHILFTTERWLFSFL